MLTTPNEGGSSYLKFYFNYFILMNSLVQMIAYLARKVSRKWCLSGSTQMTMQPQAYLQLPPLLWDLSFT